MAQYKLPKHLVSGYSTTQKPTIPVTVDHSNDLTRGLIYSTLFHDRSNLTNGLLGALGSSASLDANTFQGTSGTDGTSYLNMDLTGSDITDGITAVIHFKNTSTALNGALVQIGTTYYGGTLFIATSTNNNIICKAGSNIQLTITASLGDDCFIVFKRDNATNTNSFDAWINGVYATNSTGSANDVSSITDAKIGMGDNSGAYVHNTSPIYQVILYDRPISTAEATALYLQRYQIYKPVQDVYYTIPATAQTLTHYKLPKEYVYGYSDKVKPTVPVEVDWSNPLTSKLLGVIDFSSSASRNIVNNALPSAQGSGNQYLEDGTFYSNSTTDYTRYTKESISTFSGDSEITISFTLKTKQLHSYDSVAYKVLCSCTIGNTEGFRLFRSGAGSGDWRFRLFTTTTGATNLDLSITPWSIGDTINIAFVYDGSTMYIYQDGVLLGSTAKTGTIDPVVDYFSFGNAETPDNDDGELYIFKQAVFYNRALSASEIKSLHEAPYQLLKPSISTIYSVGTPTTVDAFTGTSAGTLGSPTATATGSITAPAITGTSTATLSAITATATGEFFTVHTGTGAGSFSVITADATGTYFDGISGTGTGTLSSIIADASGTAYTAHTGTGAGNLSSITATATGVFTDTSVTGTASGNYNNITASASGTSFFANTGTATGSLQSVTGAATANIGGLNFFMGTIPIRTLKYGSYSVTRVYFNGQEIF